MLVIQICFEKCRVFKHLFRSTWWLFALVTSMMKFWTTRVCNYYYDILHELKFAKPYDLPRELERRVEALSPAVRVHHVMWSRLRRVIACICGLVMQTVFFSAFFQVEPEESQSTACDKMQKSLELRENRTVALQPRGAGWSRYKFR